MTDLNAVPSKTADDELADKIVAALSSENLVSSEKLPKIKEGLRKGNLSSADWKLLVELSEPAATTGGAQ